MNSIKSLIYRESMKESGKIYRKTGIPLFALLILFGLARDYIFFPLMGKAWGLALSTTPDGFISNSNIITALVKSPWIIPIGAALVIVYALLSLWQITAIIVGIAYTRSGENVRLGDLIKISFVQLQGNFKPRNWMIIVYSLIIIPMTNIYMTNDILSAFIIPEYIQDFIRSKTWLAVLCLIIVIFIVYIALRWLFLLPAFVLKKKDFKYAKAESKTITSKVWLKNGINCFIYSFIELIRISIIPLILIMLPVTVCYLFMHGFRYASSLFNTIGLTIGLEMVKNVTGSLVGISIICFIVELYFSGLAKHGIDTGIILPKPADAKPGRISFYTLCKICIGVFAIALAVFYISTVSLAQTNSSFILEIFGKTDIIAHKGYSSKAPENTMPAFELADKCKQADYIELDVWSTKDGIPVVIHNSTIMDATGVDEYVYNCTYAELRKLPAPYNMSAKKFRNARIPSLEDVIKKYAHSTPLLIEIKGFEQDPQLPAKIVNLMKKYKCEDTSMIHSGNYKALEAVKMIDPDIQCGLILAVVTGSFYDLPYADFFSIEHTFVNRSTVSNLHKRDKKLYAWTVNYSESADALKFTGVDGLITDYPEDIIDYYTDTNDLVNNVIHNKVVKILDDSRAKTAEENYSKGNY